jgi:hypothetical protein
MKKVTTDSFWADSAAASPVERRVVFPLPSIGQLTVSILPGQPVPDAALMSEPMTEAAVIEPVMLRTGQVAPQLVFGRVGRSTHDEVLVVTTASGRELPVMQSGAERLAIDPMDYEQQMKDAGGAMAPAQLAAGDHAVGFLFRTDVIHFYPLAVTSLDEEVESFHDGSATTSDVIPLLPFQN